MEEVVQLQKLPQKRPHPAKRGGAYLGKGFNKCPLYKREHKRRIITVLLHAFCIL